MISPNQIKMQTFTSAGRGAYRAADVDAFMQEIYISYTELLSENASMKKKFASLSSIIDEYNAGKNAIATALVKAQAVADETMRTAKADATSIVSDAKEEANNILNETQQQAEAYAREKKETADAYFARAEQELQRVMGEAKVQSEKYVAEVNAQASAVIADANEKAAAIVGAAYKDAKVAKEKTAEIIERANVEIETTRNEIISFKESALRMLAALVPQVEGIDPNEYAASGLDASTAIPELEANRETAPVFALQEPDDAIPSAEEAKPEVSVAEAAEPEEDFDLAAQDDLIAKMESILNEDVPKAEMPEQPSLFDAPTMPSYQPYEPAHEEKAQEVFDADAAPELPTFEEIVPEEEFQSEDTEEAPFEEIDDEGDVFDAADADDEAYEDDEDDEEDEDDEPQQPFKFRLTKNFDIFDDDND